MSPLLLTLLTDFGTRDYYVGAVKGVILGRVPDARIVDLSHDIPPGDVEEAAFVLAAASRSFPPATVHLAVVDPGVGSERAILAVEHAAGRFLAPDNGLLEAALQHPGAAAVAVDRPDLALPSPGATFHGRDRFAPIAAAMLLGAPLASLGPRHAAPVRLPIPAPRREGDVLVGRVAHVDRFGNLVTDVPVAWIAGPAMRVEIDEHATVSFATHYAAMQPDEPTWMIGSLGTVEVALRAADLAARWGVQRGAAVRLVPA